MPNKVRFRNVFPKAYPLRVLTSLLRAALLFVGSISELIVMKIFLRALLLLACVEATSFAAPANDLFANRTTLTGTNVTVSGNNFGAGTEPGEDTGGGNICGFIRFGISGPRPPTGYPGRLDLLPGLGRWRRHRSVYTDTGARSTDTDVRE